MTIKKSKKHYTFHFILHTIITDKILTFKIQKPATETSKSAKIAHFWLLYFFEIFFSKSVTLFKLFCILLLDGKPLILFFKLTSSYRNQ